MNGGINILQIDTEENKAKLVEFQQQTASLGSHSFGVLKLLALLPGVAHKALIAGIAREQANKKDKIQLEDCNL